MLLIIQLEKFLYLFCIIGLLVIDNQAVVKLFVKLFNSK
jgi:hypothetical protein